MSGGCSTDDSEHMEVHGYRSKEKVIEQTKRVSSELLDATGIKGTTTKAGPGETTCGDQDDAFQVQHSWSIYDVPLDTLKKGFYRLREKLPESGWKVTHRGRESSQARDRYVVYEHDKHKYGVRVVLFDDIGEQSDPPGLVFEVASACYSSE